LFLSSDGSTVTVNCQLLTVELPGVTLTHFYQSWLLFPFKARLGSWEHILHHHCHSQGGVVITTPGFWSFLGGTVGVSVGFIRVNFVFMFLVDVELTCEHPRQPWTWGLCLCLCLIRVRVLALNVSTCLYHLRHYHLWEVQLSCLHLLKKSSLKKNLNSRKKLNLKKLKKTSRT